MSRLPAGTPGQGNRMLEGRLPYRAAVSARRGAQLRQRRKGGSLLGRNFRLVWGGTASVSIADTVTEVAFPLIAVLTFNASPFTKPPLSRLSRHHGCSWVSLPVRWSTEHARRSSWCAARQPGRCSS
jgi:hypothetical protein